MKNSEPNSVYILPYYRLKEILRIGKIVFWPFYMYKNKCINDSKLLKAIESRAKMYVNNATERKPIKDIIIVSYDSPGNFKQLSSTQLRQLKAAMNILCFSALINNDKFFPLSFDNFRWYQHDFYTDYSRFTLFSGSINKISDMSRDIKSHLYVKPDFVNCRITNSADEKAIRALTRIYYSRNNRKLSKRITTSLEWFCSSYGNSDDFRYPVRITMMFTAFELLLDGFSNKHEFAKKVEELLLLDDKSIKRRTTRRILNRSGKKVSHSYSKYGWWALNFYLLRNKIAHGDEILKRDLINKNKKDYYLVSISIYHECIKHILSKIGDYKFDFYDYCTYKLNDMI